MFATLVVASLLGVPEVFALAHDHQWSALEQRLSAKKPPVMKADDAALWAFARREACKEGKLELAAKLGALGAKGTLACRAFAKEWPALDTALTSAPPFTDDLARDEDTTTIARLALADGQDALVHHLAAKLPQKACFEVFVVAVNERRLEAARKLETTCTVTTEQRDHRVVSACEEQTVEHLRTWKALGVDLTAPRERRTCLHDSALRGDVATTKFLLEQGANVNALAEYHPLRPSPDDAVFTSVLGWGVLGGSVEVVKLLLGAGADASKLAPRLRDQLTFGGAKWPDVRSAVRKPDASLTEATASTRQAAIADLVLGDARAVLVVGGGTTREAAEQSLASWATQIDPLAKTLFSVPEGYPRVEVSEQVPGLKPGFHVVILAAGKEWQLAPLLPVVNALRPGSALRQVTWTPPSGPAIPRLKKPYERQATSSRKVKKSTLSVTMLIAKQQGDADVVATLVDASGAFVHGATREVWFGDCSPWDCPPIVFTPTATGFEVKESGYVVGRCAPNVQETTLRISTKGELVELTDRAKVTEQGGCD